MGYRVSHLLVDLGWVDLEFECSTVCLILPGLMRIWQKRPGKIVPKSKSTLPRSTSKWDTLYLESMRVAPSLLASASLPHGETGEEVPGDGPEGEEGADDPATHLHQMAELSDLRGLLRSHDELARSPRTVQTITFINLTELSPPIQCRKSSPG